MAGIMFFVLVVVPVAMLIGVVVGPMTAKSTNDKARERKLAILKEHPELAKEIWQSIEQQDVEYRANMDAFNKSVSDAFDKAGDSLLKSAERRRNNRSKAFQLGLAFARKLAK